MPSQTTNSKAKMLGPFLTLILSSKRNKAARAALRSESAGSLASHYRPSATSAETLHATEPASRAPLTLGPFLTLILTLRRYRSKNLMALAVRL